MPSKSAGQPDQVICSSSRQLGMATHMTCFGVRGLPNVLKILLVATGFTQVGCQRKAIAPGHQLPANIHVASDAELFRVAGDTVLVPVPAEDGKKLAPLALAVTVHVRPARTSETVGFLRVGARVARSEQPVSHHDCSGGWFAIRPVGFVCADQDATIDLQHPIARALNVEPNRSKPMPYQYGFLRAIAPNYLKVPTKEEQLKYEMRLERHLRNWKKLGSRWDSLEAGANDVELDANGLAVGQTPKTGNNLIQVNSWPVSDDRVPWWLVPRRQIPNLSTFRAPEHAVIADRVKRHAGVALIGSFFAGASAQDRRFAITTDARLIPADKIKPNSGSAFHGYDVRGLGLPVAFVRATHGYYWRYEDGRLSRDQPLDYRQFVTLSGAVSEFRGRRMVKTRDERWLDSDDLWVAANPSVLPTWASNSTRWIDVGIINQVMVLWEGKRPVYATLVSTGRDGVGDPQTTRSTPVGTFRIYQKHVTTTMDSTVADEEFELRDVPWVMYFRGGYALHGAYWHDEFGHARSHGCVNLSPIDARYVFHWSSPQVPEHWHSVTVGSLLDDGTIVNIHS